MTDRPAPGATESSTTGLDPHVAAMLAYAGWWLTGLVVYFIERDNRFVRFHAMQAVLAFGILSLVGGLLMAASLVTLLVSSEGFAVLMGAVEGLLVVGVVVWVVCLTKVYGGERWKLPLVGPIAERMASR